MRFYIFLYARAQVRGIHACALNLIRRKYKNTYYRVNVKRPNVSGRRVVMMYNIQGEFFVQHIYEFPRKAHQEAGEDREKRCIL